MQCKKGVFFKNTEIAGFGSEKWSRKYDKNGEKRVSGKMWISLGDEVSKNWGEKIVVFGEIKRKNNDKTLIN